MINKVLTNLSFSPSSIEQLSFYSKRLKREESVRRLGLIMVALSMVVQLFAVNFPAEKSQAYSDNHIINGIKTRGDILRAWDNPNSDVSKIYKKFGVTRKDIANLPKKPNATIRSNNNNYWSIGRNSLSGYSNINDTFKDKEIAVNTPGPTVYLRPLRAWDTAGSSTYSAFRGKKSISGETFWILVDCGNYTQVGKGRSPKPKLQVKKSIVGNPNKIKAGDKITFRIELRNKQPDSLAEDVVLIDKLQRNKYKVLNHKNLPIGRDNTLEKKFGNLQFTKHSRVFDINVQAKNNLDKIKRICNYVRLVSSNAETVNDNVCVPVAKTTQKPSQVTPSKPTNPSPPTAVPPATPPPEPPAESEIPPGLTKEVANITQKTSGQKAIETAVRPGDVIEYSLITTNSQSDEITGFEIGDYIGDILDYGELDEKFLTSQGGTYDKQDKKVIWSNVSLPASSEVIKKFRVTIKDPIPSTNSPSNTTTSFDCKISNEYGNEISMNVQCPILKTVEKLPNTGPGETIVFAFTTTLLSGYFFARSRLLAKEILAARKIFSGSGAR